MGIVLTEHGVNETYEAWRDEAQCLIEGIPVQHFYNENDVHIEDTRQAVLACGRCAVRAECLQYSLDNREKYGWWAGVGERGRRNMRRLGITAVDWLKGLEDGIYAASVPGRGRPPKQ